MPRHVKVAAAQMGPNNEGTSREEIVERMLGLLEQAVAENVEILAYPEMALTTYFPKRVRDDYDQFFETEMPPKALAPLLQRLEAGDDFAAAVLATTGLPLDRFEQEWQRAVRRRYNLGQWLMAGGGWAVVGLLVLWLVRRRRRLDRVRRAALDEGWDIDPEAQEGAELDPTPDR